MKSSTNAANRRTFLSSIGILSLTACGAAVTPIKTILEKPRPDIVCNPNTQQCSPPGGGTPPPSDPHITITQGSVVGYGYSSENLAKIFNSNVLQSINTYSSNADGSVNYSFAGQQGQGSKTGVLPTLSTVPDDIDWSYSGSTIHNNTATGQCTVNLLNQGEIATIYVDANSNLVIEYPGQSVSSTPLSYLGFTATGQVIQIAGNRYRRDLRACIAAIAVAVALSIAAAAAAAAILIVGCGDGPFAPITCAAAGIIASAILSSASNAIHGIIAHGCS